MPAADVVDKIMDSRDVEVGGGSASAVAGAMAAGLIGMVARLSTKKEYGLSTDIYVSIAEEMDGLAKALLEGAEEDTKAYCLIKNAYALPKASGEERIKRAAEIERAGIEAATVPKNNAYKCKRVHELGLFLNGRSNINAASDLAVGINLSYVGIVGCISNIEANLPIIKDEKTKEALQEDIRTLSDRQNHR